MTRSHDRMILRFIDALLDEALSNGSSDNQVNIANGNIITYI